METFYLIVISIAVLFLIISLTTFGVMLKKAKTIYTYPKDPPNCPDYWTVVPVLGETGADGTSTIKYKCVVPNIITTTNDYKTYYNGLKNVNDYLSTDTSNTYITFDGDDWVGENGRCNKYKWATTNNWVTSNPNTNKIKWDGITNINPPC